jgi:YesN/AraC family two-component response regulator
MKLYIRNMACESCKVVVKETLTKLKLRPVKVELGEAEIREQHISDEKKQKLNDILGKAGLEVVEDKGSVLLQRIKAGIIEYVNNEKAQRVNLSEYLSKKLNYDYNYISNLFSETEASTITHFMNSVKIERAKEMIMFEDHTLTEIAEKLNYSNLSHFSTNFTKIVGLPPSHFKKLREKRRHTIQQLTVSK